MPDLVVAVLETAVGLAALSNLTVDSFQGPVLGTVALRSAQGENMNKIRFGLPALVGTLSLLALLTLSRDFVEAGAPAAGSHRARQ